MSFTFTIWELALGVLAIYVLGGIMGGLAVAMGAANHLEDAGIFDEERHQWRNSSVKAHHAE